MLRSRPPRAIRGIPARKRLTETVIESVHREIGDGTWRPGDKLPTEQALIERFGVSRTVVREAIAALRADGVLESRHGVGFFVLDRMAAHGAAKGAATRVSEIVEALELRAAVEIEAAGLAALRASPGQEIEIHDRYRQFAALVRNGEPTVVADFAFHMAIARATNNPRFERFLSELGRRTIPREQLRGALGKTAPVPNRDDQLDTEHRAVAEARSRAASAQTPVTRTRRAMARCRFSMRSMRMGRSVGMHSARFTRRSVVRARPRPRTEMMLRFRGCALAQLFSFFAASLFVSLGSSASAFADCEHFTPFGQPVHWSLAGEVGVTAAPEWTVICHVGQVVAFNPAHNVSDWVAFRRRRDDLFAAI